MEEVYEAIGVKLKGVKLTEREHKTDIDACEERLNEMKYGNKKAPQKDIDVEKRKWERLHEERE